jgi:antitoxin component YwqK of YwqJK toxin-antitoxin module
MKKMKYSDLYVADDLQTGEHIFYIDKNKTVPFNGVIVDYNKGVLVWEFEVQDGFKTGIERVYYPTGELQELNETDHNTTNGRAKEFYRNGQLKSYSIVIRNVQIISVIYDETGDIVETWEIGEGDPSYSVVRDRIPEYRSRYKLE